MMEMLIVVMILTMRMIIRVIETQKNIEERLPLLCVYRNGAVVPVKSIDLLS